MKHLVCLHVQKNDQTWAIYEYIYIYIIYIYIYVFDVKAQTDMHKLNKPVKWH